MKPRKFACEQLKGQGSAAIAAIKDSASSSTKFENFWRERGYSNMPVISPKADVIQRDPEVRFVPKVECLRRTCEDPEENDRIDPPTSRRDFGENIRDLTRMPCAKSKNRIARRKPRATAH
jgi:hypothetical protein